MGVYFSSSLWVLGVNAESIVTQLVADGWEVTFQSEQAVLFYSCGKYWRRFVPELEDASLLCVLSESNDGDMIGHHLAAAHYGLYVGKHFSSEDYSENSQTPCPECGSLPMCGCTVELPELNDAEPAEKPEALQSESLGQAPIIAEAHPTISETEVEQPMSPEDDFLRRLQSLPT